MLQKRIVLIIILAMLLVLAIASTWFFSSATLVESKASSMRIASYIENFLAEYLPPINRYDDFWSVTLNEIVRKIAHFTEYAVIGLLLCSLLNISIKRVWTAAFISLISSSLLAYIDEFHQKFVPGRYPRWFDVQIDTAGAIVGIIFATLFFVIFSHIRRLNKRIAELENRLADYSDPKS